MKNCNVEIEVKHLEPFIVYEPNFEVYYVLHGDDKVVIVKEGTSLEVCIKLEFKFFFISIQFY